MRIDKGGKMKIYAYNIYMTHNGCPVDIDLRTFFREIQRIEEENRLRRTHYEYPVLLNVERDDPLKLGFSFYKYRSDHKPYIKTDTGILRQIDEDVIELTNGLIDLQENLLILQYNRDGLKEKAVEFYLNTFIEGSEFEIKIKKIYASIELNDIINSDRIISVEPVFNAGILGAGTPIFNQHSGIMRFINDNLEEAPEISLTIKNSQRNGTLSGDSLRNLITVFDNEELRDGLSDLKITYKMENRGRETKSINQLRRLVGKDILSSENNPSWEMILDTIEENIAEISTDSRIATEEIIGQQIIAPEDYIIKTLPDDIHRVETRN